VLFAEAVDAMARDSISMFVELGPHPVLLPSIQQTIPGATTGVCGRREESDGRAFAVLLATLWTDGCELDWKCIFPGPDVFVALPTYPWQRERHWYEPSVPAAATGLPSRDGLIHEVMSSSVDGDTYLAESRVSLASLPWLADHRIRGNIVVPGALFIELACETAARGLRAAAISIEQLFAYRAVTHPAMIRNGPCTCAVLYEALQPTASNGVHLCPPGPAALQANTMLRRAHAVSSMVRPFKGLPSCSGTMIACGRALAFRKACPRAVISSILQCSMRRCSLASH
jgi:acyl transferase domain-containing protein